MVRSYSNQSPRLTLKIRMTRVRSFGGLTFQIVDDMTWVSLTTRFRCRPDSN